MPAPLKIKNLWDLPLPEKVQSVEDFYWRIKSRFYYKLFLGHLGHKSKLIEPMRVRNLHFFHLGDRVLINRLAFLLAMQLDSGSSPRIEIDDDAVIGHFNHITCIRKVRIGKKVLTADRVYISDHSHQYADPLIPIVDQSVASKGSVEIGDGSWIGENAVILSCKIGRHCVVAANAFVNRDVPEFSVVAGNPARIVRRYDSEANLWKRATSD